MTYTFDVTSSEEDESLSTTSDVSEESIDVHVIEQRVEDEDDGGLCYLCRTSSGSKVIVDRSDMIDGAKRQRLLRNFEHYNPPQWDEVCSYCGAREGDEGCEECVCEECGERMRHINGINYGCVKHPVV